VRHTEPKPHRPWRGGAYRAATVENLRPSYSAIMPETAASADLPACRNVASDENGLDPVAAELFDQENLIGIFSAQPIRRVDQDRLNVALGREIAQSLQPGRSSLAPLNPASSITHSSGTPNPCSRANSTVPPSGGDRVLLLLLLGDTLA